MKNLFLSLAVLAMVSCNQSEKNQSTQNGKAIVDTITQKAEEKAAAQNPEPANPVEGIRQKVERINTEPLEKKQYVFMCDEKMTVDYFYRNGELVKIAVDFGTVGDVYAKEGYYYDDGKLIFIYEFVEGGPACEGCIKTNEYRSYIKDDKVFRYLKDKAEQQCRECEFGSGSKEYKLLKANTAQQMKAILCG